MPTGLSREDYVSLGPTYYQKKQEASKKALSHAYEMWRGRWRDAGSVGGAVPQRNGATGRDVVGRWPRFVYA